MTSFALAALLGVLAGPAEAAEPRGQSTIAEQVRAAATEAEAGQIYLKALAADKSDVAVRSAYVQRMVELGNLPRAHEAARMLVFLDGDNGTAWGVIAYHRALYGQLKEALEAVVRAAERLENDPFVLRLAGQLVAWYDRADPQPALPDLIARKLRQMRPVLESKEAFAVAYREVQAGPTGKQAAQGRTGATGADPPAAPVASPAGSAAGGFLSARPDGATDDGFGATAFRPLEAEHFAGLRGVAHETATQPPLDARLAMAGADQPKAETRQDLGIILQPFSQYGPARDGSREPPAGRQAEPRPQPRYMPRIEPYPFSGYLNPYYYAPYWPVYYGGLWPGALIAGPGGYYGGGIGYYPVVSWYPIRGTTLSVGGTAIGGTSVTITGGYTNVPVKK